MQLTAFTNCRHSASTSQLHTCSYARSIPNLVSASMQKAVPPQPEKTSEKVSGLRGEGTPAAHNLHFHALIAAPDMLDTFVTPSHAAWNHSEQDQQRSIVPHITLRHQQ